MRTKGNDLAHEAPLNKFQEFLQVLGYNEDEKRIFEELRKKFKSDIYRQSWKKRGKRTRNVLKKRSFNKMMDPSLRTSRSGSQEGQEDT